jgi:hypothetical protein
MAWNDIVAAIATGIANPNDPLAYWRQKAQIQMNMQRLQQERDRFKLETDWRNMLMKKMEVQMEEDAQTMPYESPGQWIPTGEAVSTGAEPRPTIEWLKGKKAEIPLNIFKSLPEAQRGEIAAQTYGAPISWLKKPGEGEYTLGPGEVRFKGGTKIAEVPFPVKETKPTFGMDYDKVAWTLYGKVYRDLGPKEMKDVQDEWERTERLKEKPQRIPFAEQELRKVWPSLTKEQRMQVLKIIPPDKEITEKDIVSIYANIFSAPDVRKKLEPIVSGILGKISTARGVKQYGRPEDVKADFLLGNISKEQASKILKERWPEAFK